MRGILTAAGRAALDRLRHVETRRKPDGSVVTLADLEAQERIAEGLTRHFPGVPIIGEEEGLDADPGEGTRWYVDPIDGTGAYVEGLAHWGPTIGLVEGDRPVLGALYQPRLDELWIAGLGKGAFVDGERLEPEPVRAPAHRQVLYVPSRFHRVGVAWPGKIRTLGSTAVHLAQIAFGAGPAAIIGRWSPWDVAAGILLVEEAGRVITDLDARPLRPLRHLAGDSEHFGPAEPFFAGDPRILESLADLVRAAKEG